MAVYGKLILESDKQETHIAKFIINTICDGDLELSKLCFKYILDKLKPLQKIVQKAISNLKMNSFCTPVTNYDNSGDEILYIGLQIARFKHSSIPDVNNDDIDSLSKELQKYSNKLIKEIKKLNNIDGIYFGANQEEREYSLYNPAVFIKAEKKFFEDFLKDHPITGTSDRTSKDMNQIKPFIVSKMESIISSINKNKSLMMTEDLKNYLIQEKEKLETSIEKLKKKTTEFPSVKEIRASYYDYSFSEDEYSDKEVLAMFKQDFVSVWKRNLENETKKVKQFEDLLKGKGLPNVSIENTMTSGKEIMINISAPTLNYNIESIIVANIKKSFKEDTEVKKYGFKFDREPKEKKLYDDFSGVNSILIVI